MPDSGESSIQKGTVDYTDEWQRRDKIYTNILATYSHDREVVFSQRRALRIIFFFVVCIILIVTSSLTVITTCKIANQAHVDTSAIVLVIGSFGSFISSIIVLPTIIAEHCFHRKVMKKSLELYTKCKITIAIKREILK